MRHRYGAMEMYSRFWWGTLMERDHKEHLVEDGRSIFAFIFQYVIPTRCTSHRVYLI
jgi:hypothetical protein